MKTPTYKGTEYKDVLHVHNEYRFNLLMKLSILFSIKTTTEIVIYCEQEMPRHEAAPAKLTTYTVFDWIISKFNKKKGFLRADDDVWIAHMPITLYGGAQVCKDCSEYLVQDGGKKFGDSPVFVLKKGRMATWIQSIGSGEKWRKCTDK